MRTSIAALAVASLIAGLTAAPAQATLTEVNVRIEGKSKTLFEGPILTEGHDVSSYKEDGNGAADLAEHSCDGINSLDPQNTSPGATPTAASVDAMNLIGETDALAGRWYSSFEDYFVKQWGREEENAEARGRSWGVLINNVMTSVGGCQYELSAGNEVIWIYNAFEGRPVLGLFAANEHYGSGTRPLTAQAQLNEPFEVEVDAYADNAEGNPPATPGRTATNTSPHPGATVAPVETSEKGFETVELNSAEAFTTDSKGKVSITFTTPGWHRIMAGAPLDKNGEEAAIRSNRLDVCVPAAGQSGCGAPPAEDAVRTPPRYLVEQHKEEPRNGTGGGGSAGAGAGGSPVAGSKGSTSSPTTPRTLAAFTVLKVTKSSLLLRLTAASVVKVKIARLTRGRHDRWRTMKQLSVRVKQAGQVKVRLPHLAPGRYRIVISLKGDRSVVKTLTVTRNRR